MNEHHHTRRTNQAPGEAKSAAITYNEYPIIFGEPYGEEGEWRMELEKGRVLKELDVRGLDEEGLVIWKFRTD